MPEPLSKTPNAPGQSQVRQPAASRARVDRHTPEAKEVVPSSPPADKAVEPEQRNPAPQPKAQAADRKAERELFRLAFLRQQTGDYRGALENYRALLALNPTNVVVLNNMGVVLKEMGRLDEAADILRKAVKTDPNYDKARTNLGVVLQLQDQPQAAIDSYLRAIALNDKSWESAVNLGLLFWSQGDLERAKRFFTKALDIRREPSVLYHLGAILEQQGQRLEAIHYYRQAIKKGDELTPGLRKRIEMQLHGLLEATLKKKQ